MWSPLRQEGDAKLIGPAYTVKFVRSNYTAAPKPKEHYVNVPVKLQDPALDVTIHPGDIIFGDLNGVVCVPKDAVDKILELMPKQVEADEKMAKDIAQA
ncbi:hypothetical protein ACLX1H_003000 [Fusarium chlamydosporum]